MKWRLIQGKTQTFISISRCEDKGRGTHGHHTDELPQAPGSELRHAHGAKMLGVADENREAQRHHRASPAPGRAAASRSPPTISARRLPSVPASRKPAFAARYGADPAEIDKVAAFVRGHGLTVEETNAARRIVVVVRHGRAVQQGIRRHAAKLRARGRNARRAAAKQTETYRGLRRLHPRPGRAGGNHRRRVRPR